MIVRISKDKCLNAENIVSFSKSAERKNRIDITTTGKGDNAVIKTDLRSEVLPVLATAIAKGKNVTLFHVNDAVVRMKKEGKSKKKIKKFITEILSKA